MSEFGDILARIDVDVAAATTGYTTQVGFTPLSALTDAHLPLAMTFNPSEETTLLEHNQGERTISGIVWLLRPKDEPGATTNAVLLRTDIDLVRNGIEADDDLNGLVDEVAVTSRAIDEASSQFLVAVLLFEALEVA